MSVEEDGRLVAIGDLRLRRLRKQEKRADACRHQHLEMDPDGQVVVCKECGRQLTAYWVLEEMLEDYVQAMRRVHEARRQVVAERALHIHLVAAKQVEQAWRRKMAPCCPHCRVAILPEDGLGGHCVNRELELARRTATKAADA